MSPKKHDSKPSSPFHRLRDLDRQIVDLLSRRSEALVGHLEERKSRGLSLTDADFEKRLWKIWQEKGDAKGLDAKLLRKLFNLANSLAYEQVERPSEREFLLWPSMKPVTIELPGPKDTWLTRMWAATAAAGNAEVELDTVVLNDGLYELIKAMNQAGAGFSWEKSRVLHTAADEGIALDRKSVFVGSDPFNLYLLVGLAASRPGNVKFAGESHLKHEDLRPLLEMLPFLGARGVSLVPGSDGLPLRVESSGQAEAAIPLPAGASPELTQALVLTLAFFEQASEPIEITWPTEGAAVDLQEIVSLLHSCGIEAELGDGSARIRPGRPAPPRIPEIPPDPVLSSVLLALPQALGGSARLEGAPWPDTPRFAAWQQQLRGFGAALSSLENGLLSHPGTPDADLCIDCRERRECFPIGLALCLCKPGGGLVMGERGEDFDFALELLHKLGLPFEEQSESIRVLQKPDGQPAKVAFTVPHPLWGLAIALISLVRPNIVLRNPGELTGLWPQFWSIFKGLPEPQRRMQEKEAQKKDSDEPKRRRIRV